MTTTTTDPITRHRRLPLPALLAVTALAVLSATALWTAVQGPAVTLLAVGSAAWLAATTLACFGPMPAGRRGAQAVWVLVGLSSASVLALGVGVVALVAGGWG